MVLGTIDETAMDSIAYHRLVWTMLQAPWPFESAWIGKIDVTRARPDALAVEDIMGYCIRQ